MLKNKVETIGQVSSKDLSFMRRLGFASEWVKMAANQGVFKVGKVVIHWNLAWTLKSNFFYEIARDALPIGMDERNNLIYLTNIKSSKSQVGVLSSDGEVFHLIAGDMERFIDVVDSFDPVLFQDHVNLVIEGRSLAREPIKFNINNSAIGSFIDFFPFGKNTTGKITRRPGEYVAEYYDIVQDRSKSKKRDWLYSSGLVLFSIFYFSILSDIEVEIGLQIYIFMILLFVMILLYRMRDKISGNTRRL